MKKKLLSSIISASLLLSSTQTAIFAAEDIVAYEVSKAEVSVEISEPTPELMEQTIKKVRPLIDVPEEYTEFNWDYRTGYGNARALIWRFTWTDNKNGEIAVQADNDGRIIGYEHYKYNRDYSSSLPEVGPDELQPIAKQFMIKTAPYLKDMDLRLKEILYPDVKYTHEYTYVFERYENDIPVFENTVYVCVNHISKEVTGFSSNIDIDIPFENPENSISEDEAKEILSETQKMVLSYRLKTEYDDEGKIESRKAYLVYTPELGYISVDAETGEVYTERNKWTAVLPTYGTNGSLMGSPSMKDESVSQESGSGDRGYQLSEQELAQLAVLENLISKDDATKVILESNDLFIADNAYLADARLSKQYNYAVPLTDDGKKQEKYVWNLYFSVPDNYYFGMNAVVSADDGTLISYNADLPSSYYYEEYKLEEPEIKYTKDQTIEIAYNFIKKMQPEKANNVVFSSNYGYAPFKYIETNDAHTPVYRANGLTFVRQNEGVDFTYNSFNIGVDLSTGKITRYSYTWYDDVEFESPKDAIGEKEALMALYSYDGFGINYEVNCNYTYIEGKYESVNAEKYSRAVYSAYAPGTTTIRALDGKMITYSGEEYVGKNVFGPYSDIQNHWAYDTILRFTWLGYGPEGTLFKPNENIGSEEYRLLFEKIMLYNYSDFDLPDDNLTRMQAIKYIISSSGYAKVAELQNVFITDFADNADFLPEDIGYAAIARGFGLIEGDGENFRPYDTLTRAEAYTLAENVIELGISDK